MQRTWGGAGVVRKRFDVGEGLDTEEIGCAETVGSQEGRDMAWTNGSDSTGVESEPGGASTGLTVSTRVAVQLESGAAVTGTIIDDFADLLPSDGQVSVRADEQRTVTARRWGIAVDDGTIVFVDDAALQALPAEQDDHGAAAVPDDHR